MKKNIIILEDTRRIAFGGGQEITKRFVHSLYPSAKYQFYLFDDKKNLYFKKQLKKYIKKNYFYNTSLKKLNFIKTLYQLLLSLVSLNKIIRKDPNNTIIYAPTGFGLFLSVLYKIFILDIKIIFHAHKPLPSKIISKFFFKFFLTKCNKIIVVSKFLKKNFQNIKTDLIYNIIDNSSKKPKTTVKLNKDKFHILMVANNYPYKNYQLFFSFIEKISNLNLNFHVFGHKTKILADKVSKKKKKQVFFHGFHQNPLELFNNYKSILLIPSKKPETFSLIILEAFKNKVLVAAFKSGAHIELINNNFNGYLINKLETEEIIKIVNKIINQNNGQIIENAFNFYKKNFNNRKFNISIKKTIDTLFSN